MIELTVTEIARIELLKVIERAAAKSIRIIQQGWG